MSNDGDPTESARIDRWLWAARAFKSRSIASQACTGGKVSLNDNNAKPHKPIRIGDVVSFRAGYAEKQWKVVAISEKRGPASVAQTLYEDLSPPPPPRPKSVAPEGEIAPLQPSRRPNKRERRQIGNLKRG